MSVSPGTVSRELKRNSNSRRGDQAARMALFICFWDTTPMHITSSSMILGGSRWPLKVDAVAMTERLLFRRTLNSCAGLRFGLSRVNFEPDRQKRRLR